MDFIFQHAPLPDLDFFSDCLHALYLRLQNKPDNRGLLLQNHSNKFKVSYLGYVVTGPRAIKSLHQYH